MPSPASSRLIPWYAPTAHRPASTPPPPVYPPPLRIPVQSVRADPRLRSDPRGGPASGFHAIENGLRRAQGRRRPVALPVGPYGDTCARLGTGRERTGHSGRGASARRYVWISRPATSTTCDTRSNTSSPAAPPPNPNKVTSPSRHSPRQRNLSADARNSETDVRLTYRPLTPRLRSPADGCDDAEAQRSMSRARGARSGAGREQWARSPRRLRWAGCGGP